MLSAVFLKPEIGEDRILKDLFRSFSIERPRVVSPRSCWDLNLVFKDLMSSSYEPLASKNVGKKGMDLVLSYRPEFLATENHLPRCFVLKSLKDFTGELEEGPLLCPVRALQIYLDKVRKVRGFWDGLFVSPKNPKRLMSKNGLSFFFS